MSTINAQNYGDGTDSVPASAVLEGTAKVWVEADDTATIASSYNVSSGTDAGVGDYEYDITNTISDSTGVASAYGNTVDATAHLAAKPGGAARVRTRGGGIYDDLVHSFCGFGELA